MDRGRFDLTAVGMGLAVLARGEVLGMYPEGTRSAGRLLPFLDGAAVGRGADRPDPGRDRLTAGPRVTCGCAGSGDEGRHEGMPALLPEDARETLERMGEGEMVTQAGPVVVEATDQNFIETVVEESKRRPVVVDLWASWCGPCRVIGPILEKVAEERGGAFLLAKLDVDANPYTAGQFGVQSIPTVVAFRDGKPVDGFVGAIPEPMVNEFVDRILPSEADLDAKAALEEELEGDLDDAEAKYREALETDPSNREARLGLARVLAETGRDQEARETLMPLLPEPEAERLLSRLEVRSWAGLSEPGTLASAKRLAAQGRYREALDGMLGALRDDPDARRAMLEVFAVLGDEDELVAEYRRKLANALF